MYPIHRLDRPTNGVILFAFSKEIASFMGKQFATNAVKKKYLAVVRGWMQDGLVELHYPVGSFSSARYIFVECSPQTWHWHKIRQHLAYLRHYIVTTPSALYKLIK